MKTAQKIFFHSFFYGMQKFVVYIFSFLISSIKNFTEIEPETLNILNYAEYLLFNTIIMINI